MTFICFCAELKQGQSSTFIPVQPPKNHCLIIPVQLYHNTISTGLVSTWLTVKLRIEEEEMQVHDPSFVLELYLFKIGGDLIEEFHGVAWTVNHNTNPDVLVLEESYNAIEDTANVLAGEDAGDDAVADLVDLPEDWHPKDHQQDPASEDHSNTWTWDEYSLDLTVGQLDFSSISTCSSNCCCALIFSHCCSLGALLQISTSVHSVRTVQSP